MSIVGYNRQNREMVLCEISGDVSEENRIIKYDMNAGYGMSGAPIISTIEGVPRVVGIHLFCRQRNGQIERGGIKLDEQMLKNMEKWCIREEE